MTHAERTVEEGLNLAGRIINRTLNIIKRELTGNNHTADTKLFRRNDAIGIMNRHLSRCVKLKIRNMALNSRNYTKVADDKCINADPIQLGGIFHRLTKLDVLNKRIKRNVKLNTVEMTVIHRTGKLVHIKVFRKGTSAKAFAANVNGICATQNGGIETAHVSRRS